VDYSRTELADRLAAGFAAGTLRGAARRRFETLLPAHPALRSALRGWQERLMPLTAAVPLEPAPARVWQGIESRLFAPVNTPPVALATPAGLSFWRGLAGFASITAIAFALLLANPAPALPPVVVVLSASPAAAGAGPRPSIVASISGDGRALVTRPLVNVGVTVDRALELWAIPPGGAPRSLGLISARGQTLALKGQQLQGADTLAVSLEPAGGSPTGQPTGPVLYSGKFNL
jgi:anti-sigma-K factor RskA